MNSKSDIFSFKRMCDYMGKYVNEHWHTLLLRSALMIGVMVLGGVLMALCNQYVYSDARLDYLNKYFEDADPVWVGMIGMLILFLYVFSVISASMTFSGLGSKEKRLGEIMFPASTAEKALTRWLIYVPGFLLLFIAGIFLSDWARLAVTQAVADNPQFAHTLRLSCLYDTVDRIAADMQVALTLFVGFQALFMAGSILWHKNSFVKTFVFTSLLVVAYFFVGYLTLCAMGDIELMIPDSDPHTMKIIYYVTLCVGTVFCYVLSYMRYREMDIDNRW